MVTWTYASSGVEMWMRSGGGEELAEGRWGVLEWTDEEVPRLAGRNRACCGICWTTRACV